MLLLQKKGGPALAGRVWGCDVNVLLGLAGGCVDGVEGLTGFEDGCVGGVGVGAEAGRRKDSRLCCLPRPVAGAGPVLARLRAAKSLLLPLV